MTKARTTTTICALLCVLALTFSGCAYTTVTSKNRAPKPGPRVATAKSAIMLAVADARKWPATENGKPIEHVRLFSEEISPTLRKQLVSLGLFNALYAPDQAPDGVQAKLTIKVQQFKLARTGHNSWLVAHLLLDGLVLPAFALANIGTGGEADLGAYVFPSTKMGVTLQASADYSLNGDKKPVLSRTYLVEVPLAAVSEFTLRQDLFSNQSYGAKAGLTPGRQALHKLAESMARDPHWALLPQYASLTAATKVVDATASKPGQRLRAARELTPLIKPLAYSPDEARVLRDSFLSPGKRASIINDLRAQNAGLDSADQLPQDRVISEARAKALFDDPAVEKDMVSAELYGKVFALVFKAMAPPRPKPKKKPQLQEQRKKARESIKQGPQAARPGPPQPRPRDLAAREGALVAPPLSPQDQALLSALQDDLATKVKGHPRLQTILLAQADMAEGRAWPPVEALLKKVGGPAVQAYLKNRTKE